MSLVKQLFLLSAIVVLASFTLKGQNKLAIHFDKSIYVSGEIIAYQTYLPLDFQGQDVVLKMSLVHQDGWSLGDHFLKTKGDLSVKGYFKIPYDVASGVYHFLVLGTEKEGKRRIKLGETFIPIYNDLNEEWSNPAVQTQPEMVNIPNGDLNVAIQLKEGPFQKRDKIRATIRVVDAEGRPTAARISVSVTDADLVPVGGQVYESPVFGGTTAMQLEEQLYYNGFYRHSSEPSNHSRLFGIYAKDEGLCYFSETGPDGFFAFSLPEFKGEKEIQLIDLKNVSSRFSFSDPIELLAAPPLPYTEKVKNYLEWSRSRKMIYQLFQRVETELKTEPLAMKKQSFEPDQRIVVKDYATFEDLFTFFNEVSTPLKLRRTKDSTYYAQMFNPDPRMRAFYQGDPIFIVDGTITRDVNFLQQLDLQKVDTIDLFFDINQLNRYFGKMGYSGLVIMKTRLPRINFPVVDLNNQFSISGILPERVEADLEAKPANLPQFQPQIHWMPDVKTDADGTFELSFDQSDDIGTFRIEVMAQGTDGTIGYGQTKYQVQW